MIRFLANENIPTASVRRLREAGHDLVAAGESLSGANDSLVLETAAQDHRILLTFDRDYGELIYLRHLPAPAGVIYLRFSPAHPEEAAEIVLALCRVAELTFEGRYTVVDPARIRQRPLPEAPLPFLDPLRTGC